jgi:CheY-like chemotaxis protein
MRAYLRQVLGGLYSVDFAEDGEAGLERAYATVPDLIVCDVMLPRKDGFEVCHALKSDDRTSHIPVIMLTALEGHEDRMKGLAERADDYLTKPFNEEELKQRIANLLDLRAMLQRRYARDLRFDQGAPADLSARDQKFLEKLSRYVGQHYADPELGLPALAAALAVSERNLQRKLKALVGLSPGEYLRGYRLQRAMERLLAGERPGDVAAAVGFASQAYFSTCFRTQYGFAPSEARARARPH